MSADGPRGVEKTGGPRTGVGAAARGANSAPSGGSGART
jgi:hypothetical protein